MNSLSFCLSVRVFLSFISEGQLCCIEYFGLAILSSFSTFNISSLSILACQVSAEKITDSFRGFPCKLKASFLLLLLRLSLWFFFFMMMMFLAFLLYCILLYYKCLGETIFKLNLFGDLWATQTWMFKSLPRFGEFPAIISLRFFLPSSLLLLGSINLRFFLTVISHRSGRLYSFFFNLFSFFSSEWIILSILFSNSHILSSAWSILALMLSVLLIFISFIVFFSFRRMFGSFLQFLSLC